MAKPSWTISERAFYFMMNLLLDEEYYIEAIKQLKVFALRNDIEMSNSSEDIVKVATTMLMGVDLEPDAFVMLAKLIYNIGYRDNHFKSPNIH